MVNIISRQEFESLSDANRHLVPITKMTGKKLRVAGTGVYVKDRENLFLVTANHVVNRERASLYIPWLPGRIFKIEGFRSICIEHPEVDVAVFLLREESPDFEPISVLADASQIGIKMLLAGFPASRSTSYNNVLRYEARFLKTETIENGGRFSVFNDKVNFVCDFHQEDILLGGGGRGRFADPWGMSGGAAYATSYLEGKYEYNLAGIITDWDPRRKEFIRCTKSQIISELMGKLSPIP